MSAKYGYIGNNPSDTSVVVAKQVFAPTGVQTTFTFVSGYSIGYLDVYINGARQVEGQDYNATDTSTVGLSSAAQGGDIIELVAYKAFNVATVDTIPGDLRVQGKLTVVGLTTGSNAFYSGIVTATDFNALSDENYKENVITVNNALNKVEQLRGVSFDWKENSRSSYGVIAQELQKVLPELVHGDNPKTVNYNGIIGVLIEAIKELKKEVEELKSLII